MKVNIGGDRLGSGNKQKVSMRSYERSTHDMSFLWRSSMSAGTLVPFLNQLALPGDSWDIDLNCEVLTLPTTGPLFGSYKVQLDVFTVPMRLYNAELHMNMLNIGLDMSAIKLPQIRLKANNHANMVKTYSDNEQVNPSSLIKYLGVSGLGRPTTTTNPLIRDFNAVPLLAYWDIYKNYYANKQEEAGWMVHSDSTNIELSMIPIRALLYELVNFVLTLKGDILGSGNGLSVNNTSRIVIQYPVDAQEPDGPEIQMGIVDRKLGELYNTFTWDDNTKVLTVTDNFLVSSNLLVEQQASPFMNPVGGTIRLQSFDLTNIDDMRKKILQHPDSGVAYVIDDASDLPYSASMKTNGTDEDLRYSMFFSQESLGVKTYQSDLFNNWISTEWIDGANGVNEVTKVDTTGNSFNIDQLNLAQKVYIMLNRIAISGGSYDDWLDAVYTQQRAKGVESPMYVGSLIKELGFEEVISNSDAGEGENVQPLGTLAGRGKLTGKNKGGKVNIKVDEPSYIMGLVSLTPRIDYSQGNAWDTGLKTFNDFHKPALDAIGYQDLITEQMLWSDTEVSAFGQPTQKSAGKQPAWINYMTNVNKVYGNFADRDKDMFMVLNRRFEAGEDGEILDATTYIDPTKFNHIFAQTSLDSQNFWVQISADMTARRKMSAKVIPNL